MKWEDLAVQRCSIARTVGVLGDRWTLMILRDAFMGVKRFEVFQSRLGISRTIVAERLAGLTEAGVLVREPYEQRPLRYEYSLTSKGQDLFPVLMAIIHWGDKHINSPAGAPLAHRHKACGHDFEPVMTCSECGETLLLDQVEAHERLHPQPA